MLESSSGPPLTISQQEARRLAITAQRLMMPRGEADEESVMGVVRALRFVQIDPVSAVAPSHELVLWSRLGPGASPLLEDLLWRQRQLFEYALAAAAIVLTEDYRLYRAFMDGPPAYPQVGEWVEANHALRQHILDRLRKAGPLPTGAFEDRAAVPWQSSGWTAGRNVERMLQFLWLRGRLMVAGRVGGQRLWSLTESHLPAGVDQTALPMTEALATAVAHAARALGVARESDVGRYFFGLNAKPRLASAIDQLLATGQLIPIVVEGEIVPAPSFIHVDTLPALELIQAGHWQGRTALLSPFDNLISDRDRVERLWGFVFKNEMYVPKAKRQYGYYVLPILHGDNLVGRLSPRVDRRRQVLCVEGLYLEPNVRPTIDLYRAVTAEINELANFTSCKEVSYSEPMPEAWREHLGRS